MKNFRKISLISAVTSMSFFMWACTAPQAPALQNISIDKTELSLVAGETAVITAEAVPAEAEAVFEWSTSDGDIATVSDGTVTAIETGEAVITAEAGGFKAECRITVVGIPVETITLNETRSLNLTKARLSNLRPRSVLKMQITRAFHGLLPTRT